MDRSAIEYYSRKDVQEAILETARNREVAVRFGENGYGKRPDVLKYPRDIYEFAKQGATSFHISEEIWSNPLNLNSTSPRDEINKLRIGWDLVIDVDCKQFEYSKIAADLIVQAFRHHDVKNVTVKFSGNCGFHIGIPFEAFPEKVNDKETRTLFPEGARKIALYLGEMIKELLAQRILSQYGIDDVIKKTGKKFNEVVINNKFDPFVILHIDTVLISPRHLYRGVYSLNEKSGLVSVPISPDKILDFEREMADPLKIRVNEYKFLGKCEKGEAKQLIVQAFDYKPTIEEEKLMKDEEREYEEITEAIPEQFFSPCVKIMMNGMEDGKKRAMFILVNYLISIGWDHEKAEKALLEWNKKNGTPLKEGMIQGQIRYHKQQKKKILPPNCANQMYYKDFGVCKPDGFCPKIKNPVQYSVIKAKMALQEKEREEKAKNRGRKKKEEKKEENSGEDKTSDATGSQEKKDRIRKPVPNDATTYQANAEDKNKAKKKVETTQ